ncbi:hypothetical protein Tco_1064774 [Tanacetum coccineum]
MIASSESRNSSKNMPRFSSIDMVHNHYLDEARKKTKERDRNLKTSAMPSSRFQSTADGRKPKPRSTNHSTRSLPVSKSSCITITVVPIADHSKNSNSFSDSKHFIFKGHRFSPNKTSVVYEKTSPRYDLRWKPTGRFSKLLVLGGFQQERYSLLVQAGMKVNPHMKEQSFDLSAGTSNNVKPDNLRVWLPKKADISETNVEVDSKLISKMTFEHNSSSLAP